MPNTHFGVEKEAYIDLDTGEESIGDLYFTTLVEQLSEKSEVSLIDTTGTFDDPDLLTGGEHIYCEGIGGYYSVNDDLPQHVGYGGMIDFDNR